jgi:thiol-disulfide isomerase/thioredoxin
MKKLIALLPAFLFSIAIYATEGMIFLSNLSWEQIKAKAARENKMIFFDAYTTWCGPCKYLEESVYTDAAVAAYFNANFINVKFDMEEGEGIELSEEFGITSYPTLLFFSPDGSPVHIFIGALNAKEFIDLGKEATDPAKQYYTLKNKVITETASAQDFLSWSKLADDLEDDNRGTVASTWLSAQPDILANVELAKVTLLNTDVSEDQLKYLFAQKQRIQTLLSWDQSKTEDILTRKLFKLALSKVDFETNNTKEFEAVIARFKPERLVYMAVELNLLIALNIDKDGTKGISILMNSIRNMNGITLPDLSNLLIDYASGLDKEAMAQLKKELTEYNFSARDKNNEWGYYLSLLICNSRLELVTEATEFAKKAYAHPGLPAELRGMLRESYGL